MAKEKSKAKGEEKAEPAKKSEPKAAAKAKRGAKEKADAKEKAEVKEKAKDAPRFAVIEAQGLQFRVARDEEHILPHLGQDPGAEVKIDRVLLVSDGSDIEIGKPLVEGAVVTIQVVGHEKGEKITVGTYKRRKKYRRKIGYRDSLTRVKVLDIHLPKEEKRGKHGS